MTYTEAGALMQNSTFRQRIKVAGSKFAAYIQSEAPNVEGHSARYRWAQTFMRQPDVGATELQPGVVMDPNVYDAGVDENGDSLATDAAVQSATEATAARFF